MSNAVVIVNTMTHVTISVEFALEVVLTDTLADNVIYVRFVLNITKLPFLKQISSNCNIIFF